MKVETRRGSEVSVGAIGAVRCLRRLNLCAGVGAGAAPEAGGEVVGSGLDMLMEGPLCVLRGGRRIGLDATGGVVGSPLIEVIKRVLVDGRRIVKSEGSFSGPCISFSCFGVWWE